ncbi:hypothetical protein P3T76_008254 [Phytophthora citrophthora]|uniref:Uncharacterized protein n=1 Tax=Phytophthora citrophthora TaxID=4793 RepID=A0AAD9GKX2_9STRA|nr:hypothetical protein P3T76_008254 [Phytophthora citrophthora]
MDEMEKRVKALEINNAVLSSKLQFEKVLGEMKRRDFENVLVLIAQAQREAKAAQLGFGNVLHEMKKRNFTLLLDEMTKARREAKEAKFTERYHRLRMEAQEAGISLPAIGSSMFMPTVVALTGVVTEYSDDIPLATPVAKQL